MWKENSGNLLQTAAILLSLNSLLVDRMLVKQSCKILVCHSFLLLLCLDSGSNVQTVVNLPMERAMWSQPGLTHPKGVTSLTSCPSKLCLSTSVRVV